MAEAEEHRQGQQVILAVQALNAPTASSADRKAADEYLTEFQRHPSAWKVGRDRVLVQGKRGALAQPQQFYCPCR